MIKNKIFAAILVAMAMASCQSEADKAEELMEIIRADYEAGNYELCIKEIDSLRTTYPKAIEARKEALNIYQEASLALAQANLADVDQRLQRAETAVDSLTAVIELHRTQGIVERDELHALNLKKRERDSLKGVFDVECSKIKYIHKKQKED